MIVNCFKFLNLQCPVWFCNSWASAIMGMLDNGKSLKSQFDSEPYISVLDHHQSHHEIH